MIEGREMNNTMYNNIGGAWKSSVQAPYTEGVAGSHLATSKVSWGVYDHSSLFECARCTQGNYTSYGGGAVAKGSLDMKDRQVTQGVQNQIMEEEEEEEMCLGAMEMKMMKKRKLTNEQARQLEASFEADKKLEAEKKHRLATQLGLQPRQVAVWFQNRRARSKTKQLEIDFLALKADYDRVLAHRRSLQAEIARLATQLQAKNSGTEMNCCSQDSTSSTNSNNGDLISQSTTLHIEMEPPTKDALGFHYNTNKEDENAKEGVSSLQDLEKVSNITSNYDWDQSYDTGLWVFD